MPCDRARRWTGERRYFQKLDWTGLSDIKTELDNFKQLVTGQLRANAKQSNEATLQAPVAGWTKIGPVNILPETYSGPRTDVTSVDARPGGLYAINDGFLLSETKVDSNSEPNFITPVATIPENSPLLHSVTLSTLIGRVPKRGNVFEPFNFFVQTGQARIIKYLF